MWTEIRVGYEKCVEVIKRKEIVPVAVFDFVFIKEPEDAARVVQVDHVVKGKQEHHVEVNKDNQFVGLSDQPEQDFKFPQRIFNFHVV